MNFTDLDKKFMREALKEAQAAFEEDEVPIGAVITYKNQVIARGHNMTERLKDPTAHAEMIALTAASSGLSNKYLSGSCIYISLEPCPMCAAALNWAKISKVVYACPDTKQGYSKYSPNLLHNKTEVKYGLFEEEAKELIQSFFQNKRDRKLSSCPICNNKI